MSKKSEGHQKAFNEAVRDRDMSAIELELSADFNLPHLYLDHVVRDNEFATPSLYVNVVDLTAAQGRVRYEVFMAAYELIRAQYQNEINVYVNAVDNKSWQIPKIT